MADQYAEDSASEAEQAVEGEIAKEEAVGEDAADDGRPNTEELDNFPLNIKVVGCNARSRQKIFLLWIRNEQWP
jgi:hypothetical protein